MEKVVVTGFGPFGNFQINSSWEVVKQLKTMKFDLNIELAIEEIEVAYEVVSLVVPKLWEEHKPSLMVHVGVSSLANKLTIETVANCDGYKKNDVYNRTPANGCCLIKGDACINTSIDVEAVCEEANAALKDVAVIPSCDAGRYLCEYTFYSSLCIDSSRTIFVHVPDIGKPYTVPQMAEGLKQIICSILKQRKMKK